MNHGIALSYTVEGTRHERVVIRRIAENHELCAAERAVIRGSRRGLLDHLSHAAHGVHVESCPRGADIHRTADALRPRERLRNRVNQQALGIRHPLCDQGRVTADKVDADFLCRAVQSLRNLHKVLGRPAGRAADQRNRRHGDTLIHNRNAVFARNRLAGLDELARAPTNQFVDIPVQFGFVAVNAAEEGKPHRNRADIEQVPVYHGIGFQHFRHI